MQRAFETNAPAPAGMYRNHNYAAEMEAYPAAMARYAQEMTVYRSSCTRQTAYQLGWASGLLSCIGAIGFPFTFIAGPIVGGSTVGGTVAAGVASWALIKCSGHPEEPTRPQEFIRETETAGSGGS